MIPYSAYAPECVEVVFSEVRYRLRGHLFSCRLSGSFDQRAIVRLFDEAPDVLSMLGVPVFADDKPGSGGQPQFFDQDPVIDTNCSFLWAEAVGCPTYSVSHQRACANGRSMLTVSNSIYSPSLVRSCSQRRVSKLQT